MGEFTGVWLSAVPFDVNDGAKGDALLEVSTTLTEADLAYFEWVEEGKGAREWLVPAAVVNRASRLRLIPLAEELGEL